MNDAKKRKDFESGNGPNNTKFYRETSELVNETECSELNKLTLVYSSSATSTEDTEDPYIAAAIAQEGVNPQHPVQTDYEYVADTLKRLISIRKVMKGLMSESGANAHDPWQYVRTAIKNANQKTSVSEIAAYYFFMRCKEHPELDVSLDTCMKECLKITSNDDIRARIQEEKVERGKYSSRQQKKVERVEQVLDRINQTVDGVVSEMKAKREEQSKRETWKEYMDMCKFIDDLASKGWSDEKLLNFTRQKRTLEIQLGLNDPADDTAEPDPKRLSSVSGGSAPSLSETSACDTTSDED